MMEPGSQEEIIHLLIENERALRDIYAVFADRYPDSAELWRKLSADEELHASWIVQLQEKVQKGEIRFARTSFNVVPMKSVHKYVAEQTARAKNAQISEPGAFAFALDMEMAIMEKKCFESFEGDSTEVKELMARLKQMTEEHRKMLREARKAP
jgi:rubrerythrin